MFGAARQIPATLLVAIATALGQLPTFRCAFVSLDEGQLLAIGHRLVLGEVLYRDVYTGIFPGIYWLAELLFRLFGSDVLVLRWAQLGVHALTAALLFRLVRPFAPGSAAWLAPLGYWALIVASFPALTMLSYSSLSLVCALAALVFVERYTMQARDRDGIAAGVMLGLCTLFKQNYGALALVAILISALWTRRDGLLGGRPLWRAFGVPMAAGAVVAVAAAARIAWGGAWSSFVEATFLTIFATQVDAFNQPLPPVFGPHPGGQFVFLYGPGAMFGAMMRGDPWARPEAISWAIRLGYGSAYLALALVPLLAWRFARSSAPAAVRIAARIALPFCALFFLGIFPSTIWSHLAAVYPPLLVVLVAGFAVLLGSDRPALATIARWGAAAVLVPIVVYGVRLELGTRAAFAEPMLLPGASLRVARREASLYRAADDFLGVCAQPGEPVFVAPDMPLLYVSSGRANPTPYDLIIPGDVRETVILERIKAASVSCVVFNPAMYVQFAAFDKLFPGLAEYLATEFETVRVHRMQGSEWHFLRRRAGVAAEARS